MSQPIRVIVVDDHTLVRNGLRALLETLPDVKVIGEAAGGRDALREVAERSPDVVLMDITMPDMNGLAATERVVREHPRVAVLIVSMHADPEFVARALRAGARGYLLKDASRAELELAVRSVARGGTYLSPAVAKPVVAEYVAHGEGRTRRSSACRRASGRSCSSSRRATPPRRSPRASASASRRPRRTARSS